MMNILLASSVVINGVLSVGLLEEFSASIGESCDDCYDIRLISPPPRCEEEPCAFIFEYEVVFRDSSCKSLSEIAFGLDNSCADTPAADIEAALTFDFGADYSGNQAPEVTVTEIVITDADGNDDPIMEINFAFNKEKLKDTQTFTVGIEGFTKRSNSDRNLIGFSPKRGNGNTAMGVATCYTDTTLRLLPEICRPSSSNPPAGSNPKPDDQGPGTFEYCDGGILDDPNNVDDDTPDCDQCDQSCFRGECAAQLDIRGSETTPCTGIATQGEGAICVEVRTGRVACTSDDDCDGQDRCYTLIGDVSSGTAECNESVCASSNFS